jgi:hypothetical protein
VAKIDPRLLSKLDSTSDDEQIQAVVTITGKSKTGNNVSTYIGANLAEEILSHTEIAANQKPANYRYYPKLNVLMIEASNSFIRKLIENPKISTAALVESEKGT